MSLKIRNISDVRGVRDPVAQRLLTAVKRLLDTRFFGVGGDLNKAVTFQDLIDLGLVTQAEAEAQAGGQE